MARGVRIDFDYAAFDEFRSQGEIQSALHSTGERIAEAAGGEPDFLVIDEPSSSRARVVVLTATAKAMNKEATKRSLTKALDAGRG